MFPDFCDFIKEYDICLFVETKTDDFDVLNVPNGYKYVLKNRINCNKKSGGLAVVYRENLHCNLKFYKTKSEFVQWVQISKQILENNEDLLLGCIYIPTENSKYTSTDCFTEIEEEILQICKSDCNILCWEILMPKLKL